MKFGPAEMAQMMDGAKALITVTMVSSVGIGLALGVIVALFVAFFRRGLHRNRVEPRLTNGQLLTPNASPGPNTVYPDMIIPDKRVTRSDERIFPFRLSILYLIVAFGGGVLWQYASQRSDMPQRSDIPQRPDTPQRTDLALPKVYFMLGISPLPEAVETNASIRSPLEQLSRERCDKQAIFDLARALQNAGYRREAAKVDVSFSGIGQGRSTPRPSSRPCSAGTWRRARPRLPVAHQALMVARAAAGERHFRLHI
jgi:hypothetical protein